MRLAGKTAVVLGGANGIGRATSLLFAQEGAFVVVGDRDLAAGEETITSILRAGGEALFLETDVTSDAQVERLMRTTAARSGGIDILVNCVGIDIRGSVVDTEPARWNRAIDVNLTGIYRACHFAIPHMIRRGRGSIVNIASILGVRGGPHWAAYAASKAAIIGLTRQMSVDYAAHDIRVNAISPGAVFVADKQERTRQMEAGFATDPGAEIVPLPLLPLPEGGARDRLPSLLRYAVPEEIAPVALFLAGDDSAHMTGQNLIVDGGLSVRLVARDLPDRM